MSQSEGSLGSTSTSVEVIAPVEASVEASAKVVVSTTVLPTNENEKVIQFDSWNIKDGILFLGEQIHTEFAPRQSVDRTVQNYVTKHISSKLMELMQKSFAGQVFQNEKKTRYTPEFMEYRKQKEPEYEEIYLAQLDYKLKTSKDKQFCAVYSETGFHCDFYQQVPPDQGDYIPFNRAKYLFTLTRNTYRNEDWILEFVTHPQTHETLVLFNSRHGELNIYDMKGQSQYEPKNHDQFFKRLEWVNDKQFLMHAWIWQPFDQVDLYDVDKFLISPDQYCPNTIWFENDWSKYPKVKDGQVYMGDSALSDEQDDSGDSDN